MSTRKFLFKHWSSLWNRNIERFYGSLTGPKFLPVEHQKGLITYLLTRPRYAGRVVPSGNLLITVFRQRPRRSMASLLLVHPLPSEIGV